MRCSRCWAAVLLAIGIVAASPATAATDNAYWLVGKWLCHSESAVLAHPRIRGGQREQLARAQSDGTSTFARKPDGSIALDTSYRTDAGRTGEYKDTYTFDPSRGLWTWTSKKSNDPGFLELATAAPWTDPVWAFEGALIDERTSRLGEPLRMVFVHLNDASYERDFQQYIADGKWATYSRQNCARLEPVAATQ